MAGNANSGPKREKPFRDALMLAIKDAEAQPNHHRALRRVAERLLDEAAHGNVQAIKEIADRLDGKVPQGIEGGENPIQHEATLIITGVPRPQDMNAND